MNQSERHELGKIYKRLLNLADIAPTNVTYVKGSSSGSIATRIRAEAEELAAMLNGGANEQEPDSE